jgi:hypothetical protein
MLLDEAVVIGPVAGGDGVNLDHLSPPFRREDQVWQAPRLL